MQNEPLNKKIVRGGTREAVANRRALFDSVAGHLEFV